jgi:glycosyltransferase involved in cell wall biosynthesis
VSRPPAPWLTIVTVVKDAPAAFADTVASIGDQDRQGVEFVVIDSSTDPAIVPALLQDASGVDATYQWTEPAGIYAAMNTGLRAASGDYVYFLNAGDTLARPDVLATVGPVLRAERPTWMFAEVKMTDAHGGILATPTWDYPTEKRTCFSRGHFPCHQGTFTRRAALLELGGFDTSFEIVADYAVFLRLSQQADPIHLDDVVAAFQPGGVSTERWRDAIGEFHRARREILAPSGATALRERFETLSLLGRTAAYRSLWAEGRPGHSLVARLRRRDSPPPGTPIP